MMKSRTRKATIGSAPILSGLAKSAWIACVGGLLGLPSLAGLAAEGAGKTPEVDYTLGGSETANTEARLVGDDDFKLDYQNSYEFRARGGLNHVLAKLNAGQEIRVAYLGGSITLAENGWRPRTTHWLQSRFPKAKLVEICAAINGTGADLGAARMDEDVLVHKPDLLFVEFAVNGGDGGVSNGMVKTVEGIVRKAWKNNPDLDICFVYVASQGMIKGYMGQGQPTLPATVTAQEKVAAYYAIPSINFGCVIGSLAHEKLLVAAASAPVPGKIVFTKDGTHPTCDGAQLYSGAVARSFLKLNKEAAPPKPHLLSAPLESANWERARLVDCKQVKTLGDWEIYKVNPAIPTYCESFNDTGSNLPLIKSVFPELLGTKTPGSSLTVSFKGTNIGFFDVGGPFSGQVKVTLDGKDLKVVNRFSKFNSHLRHEYFFLPELPDGPHSVVLTLDSIAPDKTQMPDFAKNPAKYSRNEFYLGKIIVIGDVVPQS